MERRVSITVTDTDTRSGGFFHRDYTVYRLKLVIDCSQEFLREKRFSELYEFSKVIERKASKHEISLPLFPEKKLNNSGRTVFIRKEMIQVWLRVAVRSDVFTKKICRFFNIDYRLLCDRPPIVSTDDFMIADFINLIQEISNSKLSILKCFAEKFLARRRRIEKCSLRKLLQCLMKICTEGILGGFVLDFIIKLTSREYFYEYLNTKKELAGFSCEELRGIKLDQFLLNDKQALSQLQAYNLLNILKTELGESDQGIWLKEILNFNEEAVRVFIGWDSFKYKVYQSSQDSKQPKWHDLVTSGLMRVSYKYSLTMLEFDIELNLLSTKDLIFDLLTNPIERKKWDLKLAKLETTENIYKFEYSFNKNNYLLSSQLEITEKGNYLSLNFIDSSSQGLSSQITIEPDYFKLTDKHLSSSTSTTLETCETLNSSQNLMDRWRVSFSLKCTGSFIHLFKDDIIHESNLLVKSLELFTKAAESESESKILPKQLTHSIKLSDACSQKLLRSSCIEL